MWKCGDYIANKIVNKIVATGQGKRIQLSVQIHRDILKAKEAQVQWQIRKFLEFVNSLNSRLLPHTGGTVVVIFKLLWDSRK